MDTVIHSSQKSNSDRDPEEPIGGLGSGGAQPLYPMPGPGIYKRQKYARSCRCNLSAEILTQTHTQSQPDTPVWQYTIYY
jgi:hypothetical protein